MRTCHLFHQLQRLMQPASSNSVEHCRIELSNIRTSMHLLQEHDVFRNDNLFTDHHMTLAARWQVFVKQILKVGLFIFSVILRVDIKVADLPVAVHTLTRMLWHSSDGAMPCWQACLYSLKALSTSPRRSQATSRHPYVTSDACIPSACICSNTCAVKSTAAR